MTGYECEYILQVSSCLRVLAALGVLAAVAAGIRGIYLWIVTVNYHLDRSASDHLKHNTYIAVFALLLSIAAAALIPSPPVIKAYCQDTHSTEVE